MNNTLNRGMNILQLIIISKTVPFSKKLGEIKRWSGKILCAQILNGANELKSFFSVELIITFGI